MNINIRKRISNIRKSLVFSNIRNWISEYFLIFEIHFLIFENIFKYLKLFSNIWKYFQILENEFQIFENEFQILENTDFCPHWIAI